MTKARERGLLRNAGEQGSWRTHTKGNNQHKTTTHHTQRHELKPQRAATPTQEARVPAINTTQHKPMVIPKTEAGLGGQGEHDNIRSACNPTQPTPGTAVCGMDGTTKLRTRGARRGKLTTKAKGNGKSDEGEKDQFMTNEPNTLLCGDRLWLFCNALAHGQCPTAIRNERSTAKASCGCEPLLRWRPAVLAPRTEGGMPTTHGRRATLKAEPLK